MQYELNLPTVYTVQAGGGEVTVNVENLTDEIIAKLVIHGLRQKVADAAASAKKLSEADDETRDKAVIASDLMEKVRKNLEAGEWGAERGAGATGDPLDKWRLQVVRRALKAESNSHLKAQFDAIPGTDQESRRAFLLKIATTKADVVDPAAEKLRDAAKNDIAL